MVKARLLNWIEGMGVDWDCHRPEAYTAKIYFLTVLKAGSPRSVCEPQ